MSADISAENERFIEQAIAEGRFCSRGEAIDLAVNLLRKEAEVNGRHEGSSETDEEWIDDLRRWAAGHRHVEQHVDFSRQSIYAGRGQ